MIRKTLCMVGLVVAATFVLGSTAQADINAHFSRRIAEAQARAYRHNAIHDVGHYGSWGGPTTHAGWRARIHHGPHCPATCACRRSHHHHYQYRFDLRRPCDPWPIVPDPCYGISPWGGYYGGGFGSQIHIERRHFVLP